MVTDKDYPLNWVIMPGASLTAELVMREWTDKPIVEIIGNRQGIFSLGILLLCIAAGSPYTDSLSITGLPFVRVISSLSFSVVVTMKDQDRYGRLIRTDKDKQFEWLINYELLERDAIALLDVSFTPDGFCGDHFPGNVGPDTEVELFFARNDIS